MSEEDRKEIAKQSQEEFLELVNGEVERGDPVKVVMEDGRTHLTFFGWFPIHATYNAGGMMICSRDGDKLTDTRGTRKLRAENVHVIIPLEEKSSDVTNKNAVEDETLNG